MILAMLKLGIKRHFGLLGRVGECSSRLWISFTCFFMYWLFINGIFGPHNHPLRPDISLVPGLSEAFDHKSYIIWYCGLFKALDQHPIPISRSGLGAAGWPKFLLDHLISYNNPHFCIRIMRWACCSSCFIESKILKTILNSYFTILHSFIICMSNL